VCTLSVPIKVRLFVRPPKAPKFQMVLEAASAVHVNRKQHPEPASRQG